MSVFSAVTVELNKDILNSLGSEPVHFFEDIVRQSGVEIHVADDGQFVKVSGDWSRVSLAHQLINAAVYGEQSNEDQYRQIATSGVQSECTTSQPQDGHVPILSIGQQSHDQSSDHDKPKLQKNVPEPFIIYSGKSSTAEQASGLIKAVAVSSAVSDVAKEIPVTNYSDDVEQTLVGKSNIVVENKGSVRRDKIVVSLKKRRGRPRGSKSNSVNSPHEPEVIVINNSDHHDSPNTIIEEGESYQRKYPESEPERTYIHKKLSTRHGAISVHTLINTDQNTIEVASVALEDVDNSEHKTNNDSGYTTERSRRLRKPPKKFDETWSKKKLAKGKRTTRQLDESCDIVKQKVGRPRIAVTTTNIQCEYCEFVGKRSVHLSEHMKRKHLNVSGTDKFSCQECDRVFGFLKDLKRHKSRHREGSFCCDLCGKKYKGRLTYEFHLKKHDADYVAPVKKQCNLCSKSFCNAYILKQHIQAEHHGIRKAFGCPKCGKTFSQKHAYIQHANVHLGIKPYVCKVCSAAFSYITSLNEHMNMHSDERKYMCKLCGKTFRQKSAMIIHTKIHKSTRDFICYVCSRGFTQKQALLRHERTHSGAKPFVCKICTRAFSDRSIIRRHIMLVHKGTPPLLKYINILHETDDNYFIDKRSKTDHQYADSDAQSIVIDNSADVETVDKLDIPIPSQDIPALSQNILAPSQNISDFSQNIQVPSQNISVSTPLVEIQTSPMQGLSTICQTLTKQCADVASYHESEDLNEQVDYPLNLLANEASRSKFVDVDRAICESDRTTVDGKMLSTSVMNYLINAIDAQPVPVSISPGPVSSTNPSLRERLQIPPMANLNVQPIQIINPMAGDKILQQYVAINRNAVHGNITDQNQNATDNYKADANHSENAEHKLIFPSTDMNNDISYPNAPQSGIAIVDIHSMSPSGHVIAYPYTQPQPQYEIIESMSPGVVSADSGVEVVTASDVTQNMTTIQDDTSHTVYQYLYNDNETFVSQSVQENSEYISLDQ